jgi:hypothetical protein
MDRIRLIDIVHLLKENDCDYRWLDVPHVGGVGLDGVFNGFTITKKYSAFLEDIKKHPNTLFHIYVNWKDNENPIWWNNMMRYLITNK